VGPSPPHPTPDYVRGFAKIKDIKAIRKPEYPYPEIAKHPETLKQPFNTA
jgi:hypothetical protein